MKTERNTDSLSRPGRILERTGGTYFDFTMFVIWLITSLALAWFAFSLGGVDFNVYYAAGRITLSGGNPYDYTQLSSEIVSHTEINNPYYYAPWFTWATLPIVLLPYRIARLAWAVINVALWYFSLINLRKLVDWPNNGWKRWGTYLSVTLLFAWTTWGFEQVGILIFFILTMVLLSVVKKKWTAAGIWIALLLFKPNITGLPVAAICTWLLLQKKRKTVIVAGLATLGMIVISMALSPGWYLALLQPDKYTGLSYKFSESGEISLIRYNTTLLDWLATINITGSRATIVYVAAILLGISFLLYTISSSKSLVHTTAMALLINFALTPYALFYDYPALTMTIFHANNVTYQKPLLNYLKILLNLFIVTSLFIGNTISYRYWTTIAIGLLVAFRYTTDRNWLRDLR